MKDNWQEVEKSDLTELLERAKSGEILIKEIISELKKRKIRRDAKKEGKQHLEEPTTNT